MFSLNLWSNQMCAGGEGRKDSCNGDSGGPLMYYDGKHYQATGIVSFGHDNCGTDKVPGVYTRVSAYNTWIRRHIKP
jgi:secreted trypsin-like serine protease